jgi:hypothetical protein
MKLGFAQHQKNWQDKSHSLEDEIPEELSFSLRHNLLFQA